MKNHRLHSVWVIGVVACLFSSCASGDREMLTPVQELTTPASGNSGEPNLAVGANGDVYLSWIEGDDAGANTLKFATRTPQGWSEPRTVVQSDTLFRNWADYPSLFELPDGNLAAHWLSTVPEREGYNVSISTSRDKGETWSPAITPHRDGTATEHGFVSLVPANGGVGVTWLDSRKLESGSDDVSLMYTNVGLDGTLGTETVIDDRVCECCQPSSIVVSDGLLLAYRDRSSEEIRDIALSRFDGTRWSAPRAIFNDGWEIYACPIQGPAISASGENVVVAWFTAADDKPKVEAAFSADGGNTFGEPVQLDEGDPVGRVDAVALEGGGAVVTWIEHTSTGGEVRARQVGPTGQVHDALTVGKTSLGTASGFPRVERSGDAIIFAWTDTDEHRIRTAVSGE